MKVRYFLIFGLILFTCAELSAQLDTKHWIPPFYAKPGPNTGTSNIKKHFVSLSTPSVDTIPVTIKDGFGNVIDTVSISRNSPQEYIFGPEGNGTTNTYPLNVIPTDSLNEKIRSQGLYFESYQPFFVNMRHKSGSQGTSLTSKGQIAKGKRFYAGHLYTTYNEDGIWNTQRRSHFISVMATEDNTIVTFDMIKDPIHYIEQTPGEPITVVLDAFESYVIGIDHGDFDNTTINLANGTRITSTKPIVCNSGSWLAGNQLGQCIGSDQLVPAEITGEEYVLVRGLGDATTERPMVIATENNTDVYLNDGTLPVATLDEGEFYIIPTADFTANGNLYILASEKVYVYQTLSGSATNIGQTVGLSFIPPLNCIGAKVVNLPFVNSLAGGSGQGRVNIITKVGTSIYVNENPTPLTGAQTVTGNADWVTYSFDPTTDNVIIESDSVMNVALLTRDVNVGTAGYFSGFTLEPVVGLSSGLSGTTPCIPGNAVLQVFGFDTYQWFFNGEEIVGATDNTLFPEFAGDYMVEGIDLACGFRFPSNDFAIPFCPSTLGAAKEVQSVEETSPGSRIFDVAYHINIENFAISPSENIQVMENINGLLAVGATAELIGTPEIIGSLSGVINPAFDGVTVKQLLNGNGSLPGSGEAVIQLVIRVNMNVAEQDGYENQIIITSKNGTTNDGINGPFDGQDFSHEGSQPDPNGNGEPNEDGENNPTLTCFFSNDITYGEMGLCTSDTSVEVELDGISSGAFTATPSGLSLNLETGTINPSDSDAGTYTVSLTTGGRCGKTTQTEVTIVVSPNPGVPSATLETCMSTDLINLAGFLDGEDDGGVWTNAEGNEISAEYEPSEAGVFPITYTLTSDLCDPVSQTITINVIPEPNPGQAVVDPSVCITNGAVNLFDFLEGEESGGQWFDEVGSSISADVTLLETGVFNYSYQVTNDACGSNDALLELNVIAVPDAGVSVGEAMVCSGESLNLFEFLIGADLDGSWADQNANDVPDETTIDDTGTFVYTYTIDRQACETAITEVTFEVVQGPSTGSPDNNVLICTSDPTFNLIELMTGATPGGVWTDSQGDVVSGIFDPELAGAYTYYYTVTSDECGDIESLLSMIVSESYCNDGVIVIPQGFSPNNDGIADLWIVKNIEQYAQNTLLIFNRWGEKVYSARPYTNDWDGNASGGLNTSNGLPVGTYWYIIDLGDGSDIRKGFIYLNR